MLRRFNVVMFCQRCITSLLSQRNLSTFIVPPVANYVPNYSSSNNYYQFQPIRSFQNDKSKATMNSKSASERDSSSSGNSVVSEYVLRPVSSSFELLNVSKEGRGEQESTEVALPSHFGAKETFRYSTMHLDAAACRLYQCIIEMVDYNAFRKLFPLQDTMMWSWANITFLHMWLLFVRLAQEGHDGLYVRTQLTKAMWRDVKQRMEKLGTATLKAKRRAQHNLDGTFHATIIALDEGLISNDWVLAGGLWREFFNFSIEIDPTHLELLVGYLRAQLRHLDSQTSISFLLSGIITLLPFPNYCLRDNDDVSHSPLLADETNNDDIVNPLVYENFINKSVNENMGMGKRRLFQLHSDIWLEEDVEWFRRWKLSSSFREK